MQVTTMHQDMILEIIGIILEPCSAFEILHDIHQPIPTEVV
jgi:hypothetical protein